MPKNPKYIQLKRVKGFQKPENTIVVSRPFKYGNPFKVGEPFPSEWYKMLSGLSASEQIKYHAGGKIEDTAEAVYCFEKYLNWLKVDKPDFFAQMVEDLRGKNLACWCKTGQAPCHAKILLKVVNE